MTKETDSKRLLEWLGLSPDTVSEDAAGKLMDLAASNARLSARIDRLERKLERAESLADNDPLCPLFNRRAFMRELAREIALAGRYKSDLCVLYIDLDQFKRINDTHGHEVGDEVLVEVSRLLRQNVRRTDIVGRIGGDEFAIVLVRSDQGQANIRVEVLRETFRGGSANLYGVKASIGAVAWQAGMSAGEIMQKADHAMFANKAGLKNT